MSNAKLLRQLIKTGLDGDADGFKAASEAAIREERKKKHHRLANDLERLLCGERSATGRGHLRLLPTKELPTNMNSGLALGEKRPAVRDETDIVLGGASWSIVYDDPEPYARCFSIADRANVQSRLYARIQALLRARVEQRARAQV